MKKSRESQNSSADMRRKSRELSAKKNKVTEVLSVTSNTCTSDRSSTERNPFLAKSKKHPRATPTDITSDDISEISNESDENMTTSEDRTSQQFDTERSEPHTNSDYKSYRDKIKERFRNVKKKSFEHLERNQQQKFKNRSQNIISLNKSIEHLRNENLNLEQQLKAYNPYQFVGGGNEASATEKYQFFCESLPYKVDVPSAASDNEDIHEDDDENKPKEGETPVVAKRAEKIKELLVKSYEEMIWIPHKKQLIFEPEVTDRNMQDEGLYVSKAPLLSNKSSYILQQRLLASDNKLWFDPSGHVKYEESNYSEIIYRPDGYAETCTFNVKYVKPSRNIPINLASINVSNNGRTLEINVQSLHFQSHSLFSAEHILQEDLIHHFDAHKDFKRLNKREKLFERLQSLRKSHHDFVEMSNASGDASQTPDESINLKQIKSVRQELYKECKLYRENVKQVLVAWKKLKAHREQSALSNTSIKLVIIKREKAIHDDIEIAYNEMIQEEELEYKERMKTYREQLSEWKHSEDGIEEDRPLKPPRSASAKKLRAQVQETFEEVFGPVNEPDISFTINYSHEITKLAELNDHPEEKQRRNTLTNTKIFLKFFWDNTEICKSKTTKLSENFTAIFDESISLELKQLDLHEVIRVKVIEQYNFSKKHLCTIKIKVPKQTQQLSQSKFEEQFFEKILETRPQGNNKSVKIAGFLTYCIGWSNNNEQVPKEHKIEDILNDDGTISTTKLKEWVKSKKPDPEDPRNAIIFNYLRESNDSTLNHSSPKYFRCDPFLETFTICHKDQIEDNIRIQLLQLRDRNEPEFIDMIIPNRLKEIPTNIFSTYKRRLAQERYQEYFEEEDAPDDDIIAKRSLGRKYFRQIYTKLFQICRNSMNNLTFEDVVDEKMLQWLQTYLKTMMINFFNWFKFKPALNRQLPIMPLQNSEDGENLMMLQTPNIIIHLKSGKNLPVPVPLKHYSGRNRRKSSTRNETPDNDTEQIPSGSYYIEITYENVTVKSALVNNGNNPVWNEKLQLPLNTTCIDYLNSNSLSGSLSMNLFHQVEQAESSNLWLGNVEIPISAVISDSTIFEGEFQLNTPAFNFGYEKNQEMQSTPGTPRLQPSKTYSTIEISFQTTSTIPKINIDMAAIDSSEPPYLRDHILNWNKRFNDDHMKRKFKALAIDSNGKTVCLTRFIKALEPPQLNSDGFDVTLEQCTRYVSLIPFTNVNKLYQNIWLTAEQMLKLGIGSVIDHAVLLTCYLLSLNLEVWLLLGFGIPQGFTAYVLLREYQSENTLPNHFIIDVINATKYNVTDPNCPLKRIHCIVNSSNIWGNVQRGDTIATTRFDFTKKFDWSPLFNQQISSPTNSIQQKLHYLYSGNALSLQSNIEKKLRKKIASIRKHEVTIWNHYASNLLRNMISKTEVNYMHNKPQVSLTNEVLELMKNCNLIGSVQCLPFSSVKDSVEAILKSKLHEIIGSNVEFASAIQVDLYTNQVVAIWAVFVALIKANQ